MRVRSASLLLAISACVAPLRAAPPSEAGRIDLSTYRMSFDEPFDTLDVSPHGPGTRWTAHTPWNGDFGEARFVDPAADAPFEVKGGKLSITMDRKKGFWRSGLLASMVRREMALPSRVPF